MLAVMTGCGGERQADNDDLIAVDVTKNYSSKKELILQDFMDVEYIALETNDDFINQGFVQDIGKEFILVKNRNRDGDIFVYDRTGKAIRKINRKGQGSEEYINCYRIVLDEDNGEMFVSDIRSKKIIVYDLYGNYKRSFKQKEGGGSEYYIEIFSYDKDHLICCDQYNEEITFILVSKQDGNITKEIKIPFKEKKLLEASRGNVWVVGGNCSIIPYKGNWILLEHSCDTVYTFLPDYSLRPFMVRTPSVQSMDPEVMLVLRLLSGRYYFMEAVENKYDFDKMKGFKKTYFMYDKQENAISGYGVYNGDYSTKKEVYMVAASPVNHEIVSWYPLEANQLVESYGKGELKGKLKEIAATLDEESNPVIMLIKHKK
jgi:hypothetical protein